ncbi:exodeoxyribonuclease VII large subunit, partial [Pseudoalteromonas sp. SIMBA_162]|uniref:exodeoxyribonuclease VII large subunit n=1 Tax=Pseudoalteromonas sp. SIMBA_162 TaxID=3080867 RepID=UPI0039793811
TAIKLHSPKNDIQYYSKQLEQTTNRLTRSVSSVLNQKKDSYLSAIRTLEALNPLAIMTRGYSVSYKDHKVIKSISQLEKGEEISI